MPFIRDYAYLNQATASNSIIIPMPQYAAQDLLLAFITADGGMTGTTALATSSAGWTVVGAWAPATASTSTAGMVILCKYAAASETDPTFTLTSATADTVNGTIISIGDVFYDAGTGINAIDQKTANLNATATWTAARTGYPLLTTTQANELIMYFAVGAGTGATGVASILEGPCHNLIGKDGSAHTDGIGWAFKKTAGAIAANTVFAQVTGTTAPAGYMAQLSIKQPSGGATVIPTYIATDSCKLINIGTGNAQSTVYGNSSATGANSTQFPIASLTLNGRPVVAGGTTYTYTDQGINTFHSAIGILGVTTARSWASNSTAHAAMTDLANENILLHLSPQLPIDIQTTDSGSLTGACGLAVGLASTAGNCKVWHVHGAGTAWDASRYVPVVINTGNTTGIIGSVGTLNTASITLLGLFLSCKAVAAKWTVTSIWRLATTIFCGGNAAYPLDISAVYDRIYIGKERRSLMYQGAGQVVVYQPIQFGNGATDPIYADLGGVAFEFPAQYNKAKKQLNYCSIDNKTGVTFFPGAGDVIDLRAAVFSSPNKFTWGFNTSSAGTVYTDGIQVIGAGTITLAPNINLTSVLFSKCSEITASTNTLTSITFDATTSTTGSISITGSTQTALQTALDKLVSCSWTNNAVGLRIIYTGTAGPISLNMSTGYFSTNTVDVRWEAPAASPLTINKSGTVNPSTYSSTNSNTVTFQSSVTLQLTGLVSGSDIVILDAGTETERININANSGTTYNYVFSTGGSVDICVYKQGYIPFSTRAYTLPATNGSLPIQQVADRNFSNPA
jgi:hypothetical protein